MTASYRSRRSSCLSDTFSPYRSLRRYLLSLLLLFSTTLYADTFSFVFENDLFAGTDQHFTNGVRLEWLGDPLKEPADTFTDDYTSLLYQGVDSLPFLTLDPEKHHNAGFSVYQMMFTPKEINSTEPDYNDIPYAGHLMFSFFLFEYDDDVYDEYKMQIGIVGPASGAEAVQKWVHRVTDSEEPMGWDTQLGTQLTLGISYDHGHRVWKEDLFWGLSGDLIGNYGGQLGNFTTGLTTKADLRIGHNFPDNFNTYYPGTTSDSALLALQNKQHGFGWSVTTSLLLDALGYFYITDSDPDYNLDRTYIHSGYIISISLYYEDFVLSVTKQDRLALKENPAQTLTYGAISLIWNY